MKRSCLRVLALALPLLLAASSNAADAPDNKKLKYEGRTLAEWLEIVMTAELGTAEHQNAFTVLVRFDEAVVLSEVLEVLKSGGAPLRSHAIILICALPDKSKAKAKKAVPALITALKDESEEVRAAAAWGLGKFGPEAQAAVQPLTVALEDQQDRVRIHAAAALACIDRRRTKDSVAFLAKMLKGKDPNNRLFATDALGNLAAKEGLTPLSEALQDEHEEVRFGAVSSLQEYGRKAEPVVPALIRAMNDTSPRVRRRAIEVLGNIGPGARAAVRPLIDALKDEEAQVRGPAADTLGAIGPAARQAEEALTETLKDENAMVALQATCALGRINPEKVPAMVSRLVEALRDEDFHIRVYAISALTVFGPKAKAAVKPLTEALKDPDALVRSRAAFALNQIDPEAVRRAGVKEETRKK